MQIGRRKNNEMMNAPQKPQQPQQSNQDINMYDEFSADAYGVADTTEDDDFFDTSNIAPSNNIASAGFVQQRSNKSNVYTKFDFEREVFGTDVVELLKILDYKKNIILQGAPGVGKTHTAKRLAFAKMGVRDESRVLQVQFHQNYTYDDFIVGLRPTEDGGFKFEPGPFYLICEKARNDKEHKDYFVIIDEINRGNLSKILGEGFSLIEKDHRNEYINLKYNNDRFCVPDNLYIIGTMNTADRGLVMLDYALRRRFAFITTLPAFKSEGFRQLLINSNNVKFNKVVRKIVDLNKAISADELLGPGFMIGHSYFCLGRPVTDEDLKRIVDYEIIPLLQEYWYDDAEGKVEAWKDKFYSILFK